MNDITIRIAGVQEASDISFLGKKTFDQSFGHLFRDRNDLTGYLETTFSIEKLHTSMVKSDNVYWIVYYGDVAVGYAKIQLNSPSEFISSKKVCKLQKIYMLKEYLSMGIGAQLQEHIFDKVKTSGIEFIWLSVLKSNEKAVVFYKRNDYQIIGEHPFSIGKENFEFWVMSKKIH
ncbi:GNAT family N-acetyltransferase [Aquimarina sp. 2201CG14-23]|uniref:GNAT family N-acetyltransferase n=1 Tax=Aquimarina mycalae TaxID=3040073 RepID=UPI002477EC74|nr:GNAT family N-acetyltransferase [Aquimarina sp. 2201CG14-23]MDH7445739.1 GNAT family N-acetyltransferase [Aquimarina sp. 2201CG14-23]